MTERRNVREQLLQLAGRGEVRGADAVVAAALREAARVRPERNDARRDAALAVVDRDADVVVAAPERRRTRSPWRSVVASAGIAALLGVTMVAITAIGDRGGASSPEDAVRDLARAVSAEDPLAAVDVIAPDEVRTLHATVEAAARKAQDERLVEDAGAPFKGFDVDVSDLTLSPEPLADGYVKVHLTGGRLSASTDRRRFSPLLRDATPHWSEERWDESFAEWHPFDVDPFVVAIRRDGRWYVSAAYTALEYVRAVNDLPAADYGSALRSRLGADSPEAAARELVTALGARDWNKVFALLPPDEAPLYDYRVALGRLLDRQDFGYTVTSFDATADTHGDAATVSVKARGKYATSDGDATWELANDCIRQNYPGDRGSPYGWCLSRSGTLPIDFFDPHPGDAPATVQAVRRDGRWFLSPVATSLDVLDAWVANFDERALYSLLRDYAEIPADGTLTLGDAVTVTSGGLGLGYAYTFHGERGQEIVGEERSGTPGDPFNVITDGVIVGPDGQLVADNSYFLHGEAAVLPSTGTYKVVVVPSGRASFTLWDKKDAPPGVATPDGECSAEPGASCETYTGTSGSASTPTTVASVP